MTASCSAMRSMRSFSTNTLAARGGPPFPSMTIAFVSTVCTVPSVHHRRAGRQPVQGDDNPSAADGRRLSGADK